MAATVDIRIQAEKATNKLGLRPNLNSGILWITRALSSWREVFEGCPGSRVRGMLTVKKASPKMNLEALLLLSHCHFCSGRTCWTTLEGVCAEA